METKKKKSGMDGIHSLPHAHDLEQVHSDEWIIAWQTDLVPFLDLSAAGGVTYRLDKLIDSCD